MKIRVTKFRPYGYDNHLLFNEEELFGGAKLLLENPESII
jgi:hypothetical protein